MKKSIIVALTLLLVIGFALPFDLLAQKNDADRIVGEWYTGDDDSRVKIFKSKGKYYGQVKWLKNPNEDNGKPKVDDDNPDPKLKSKPLIGLLVMKGFTYEGDGEWANGTIYDPGNGNTYKCKIRWVDGKTLDVRGYVGKSWMGLGRTQTWSKNRVTSD